MNNKKIRITEDDRVRIAATPQRECWICEHLINNVMKDEEGYYIEEKALFDDGIKEHFRQLTGIKVA